MDFATAPAKSLPMQAFMLYMSGGGVQIFSMGIVFMLLLTPFKNLAGINEGARASLRFGFCTNNGYSGSFRAVRAYDSEEPEGSDDAHTAEAGVRRVQPAHTRRWAVEVSIHGATSVGYRRLAGV